MTGRGAEPFSGATLAVTDMPEEKYRAMRYIAGAAHDADDARLLLDVVFGELKAAKPPRGMRGAAASRQKPGEPKATKKRTQCGTPPAYRRHLANAEEPCQPCRDAIAAVRRLAREVATARKEDC